MEWQYPIVRHFIICRRPFPVDAEHHEAILRVVFGLRPTIPYPFRMPELHAFVQLADATGTFEFAVEVYRSGEHELLAAGVEADFEFPDRLAVFSFFRGLTDIPFREAGLYEFRLFARLLRNQAGEVVHNQPRRLLATEPLLMEARS